MSTLNAELRKEGVLAVLAEIGGWLSAGAIWNRIEVPCTKAQVDAVLAGLVAEGEVHEIHGLTTAEFALAGVALPDDCRQAQAPRQINAEGYKPAEANLAPASVPSQKAPPPTPPRSTAPKPQPRAYTREEAKDRILELLGQGMTYTVTELAKLMASHGGTVLGAVVELRGEQKIERFGQGNGSKYRLKQPGSKPNPPLPARPAAPAAPKAPAAPQQPRKAVPPRSVVLSVAPHAAAPAAAPAATTRSTTRFAMCDDGELIIRRVAGGDFVLDEAETRNLFAFVRRMDDLAGSSKAAA